MAPTALELTNTFCDMYSRYSIRILNPVFECTDLFSTTINIVKLERILFHRSMGDAIHLSNAFSEVILVQLSVKNLNHNDFSPFGDVIETDYAYHFQINGGTTTRYHDLAAIEAYGPDARTIMSIFEGQAHSLPIELCIMERHPLGSQAFVPLDGRPYLVVVAEDLEGIPDKPKVFLASGKQGVNYKCNVWHHPLIALQRTSNFLVIDRAGDGENLEEYFFDTPYYVQHL